MESIMNSRLAMVPGKEPGFSAQAVELRRQAEEQLRLKNAGVQTLRTEEEMQRLIHELKVHQIELELQNATLRQSRDEVETLLEKYTDLYDLAPVSYFTLDNNGIILDANLTGASFLGVARARLIGRNLGPFIATAGRSSFVTFLGRVFASSAKEICEVELLNDGSFPRFVQIGAVAAASGQECRVGLFDITERKLAEKALREARAAAESANRAKSEFLATMVHEIRTSLHTMLGAADILEESGLDQQQGRFAAMVTSSGAILRALLDDILDLSRIEAGMMQLRVTPFVVEGVIEQVHQMFLVHAEEKGLTLASRVLLQGPLMVTGDRQRLLQILANLVGNALKFTACGVIEVIVGPAPDGSSSKICFTVSDTGIGIAPEQQQIIFNPFSQLSAGHQNEFSGTGLGLAIVAGLTEAMGGRIDLVSEPGIGSVFSVTLPLEPVAAIEAPPRPPVTAPLSPFRILAVDDIPENLELLRYYFGESLVVLTEACSGAEALGLTRTGTFDCVLLDIQMPEMSGYEVVAALRADETECGRGRTPVIGISAGAFITDHNLALKAGCDTYLTRPFSRNELLAAIGRIVGQMEYPPPEAHNLKLMLAKVLVRLAVCVDDLEVAALQRNFGEARRLGHTVKGLGMTFDLTAVERLGKEIEAAVGVKNVAAIAELARQLREEADRLQGMSM